MLRFVRSLIVCVPVAAFALLGLGAGGCVVSTSPSYADTQIEFEETRNLGYGCGGPLTDWTVFNRDTEKSGAASCSQPVLFTNLQPNRTYTFDIEGYSGNRLCWTGTCAVRAYANERTFADCSRFISNLCGF